MDVRSTIVTKVRWSRFFLAGLIAVAILSSVIGNLSFWYHFDLVWTRPGHRNEIDAADGEVVYVRLSEFKFPPDGKAWYGIERQYPLKRFASPRKINGAPDPWKGDGIGFDVKRRWWLPGLEWAAGEFTPPFVWRHPRMPFHRWRISTLWPFTISSAYLLIRWARFRHQRLYKIRSASSREL